jgi:hypothetical protein
MKLTMSRLAYRLALKAEQSGNNQSLVIEFGDGRAMEVTHRFPTHLGQAEMMRAVLINPVDVQQGVFKYVMFERRYNELKAFGVDDKKVIMFSQPEELDRFVDEVWNHLIYAQTELKWD